MDEFETDRLLLRQWREEDLDPFAAMNADLNVMEFFPSTLSRSESDELVKRINAHFDENGFGLWAVEWKQKSAFIGFIGLWVPRFDAHFTPCVEIGWRLAHDYWGNGFATEGANAVLELAFGPLGLSEVVSMTAIPNTRSMRVMEKIGMSRDSDGDFDHPLVESERLARHVLYRIQRT